MIFHELLDIFEHSEVINEEKTDLETLTHLQLILVWKIFHQPRYLQALARTFG